jgi:hypothetical protein
MHCDFAFWVGSTADNGAIFRAERLPGVAGARCSWGPTGALVADDAGVAAILASQKARALSSEDEFRLDERKDLRAQRSFLASHLARRNRAARDRASPRIARTAPLDPCCMCPAAREMVIGGA